MKNTAASADSHVGHGTGVVVLDQAGDEVVQLPQPRADGLALAEVLYQEKEAEEQVKEGHLPA